MHEQDVFAWNKIVGAHLKQGQAEIAVQQFFHMLHASIQPDEVTFVNILKACCSLRDLELSKQVHCYAYTCGKKGSVFVENTLIDMYGKCGCLRYACKVFNEMPARNVVSWTVMILIYCKQGHSKEALKIFDRMEREGVVTNELTIMSVLNACAQILALEQGKYIHACIVENGNESNIQIGSSLINMYSKCGSMDDAWEVFDQMAQRDLVTYNILISGCVLHGHMEKALQLFEQMELSNLKPDEVTYVGILKACTASSALQEGKQIHNCIMSSGIQLNIIVENALIDMYVKCGSLDDAHNVFGNMHKRNVISWTTMISGYMKQEDATKSLQLYRELLIEKVKPNQVTLLNMVNACANLRAIEQGKQVHAQILEDGVERDVVVNNSLLNMYIKCGSVKDACQLFKGMVNYDVISWTSMMAAYAEKGYANKVFLCFEQMGKEGFEPDGMVFVSLLKACSIKEDLKHGKYIHAQALMQGFDSEVLVISALVDMYAKCKSIEDAHALFDKMTTCDTVLWTTLITGNVLLGNSEEALHLFRKMLKGKVSPNLVTCVSVLNACANMAALEHGKLIHAYVIEGGVESDNSISSSLMDMYSKSGSLIDARRVLIRTVDRNVVCWTSMIAGYALHGNVGEVLSLADQMQQEGVQLNHITYLNVMCTCSHAGHLELGLHYFYLMSGPQGIKPVADHYACLVDILGRAGRLEEAEGIAKTMPLQPSAVVWRALLGACRIHGDLELAINVTERVVKLEPENAAALVLLANMYASSGRWEDRVQTISRMKGLQLVKDAGCSWIEVGDQLHAFRANDTSHSETKSIHVSLNTLLIQIKEAGYEPDTRFVLREGDLEDLLSHHSEKLAIAFGIMRIPPWMPIRIIKNLRVCGDCHTFMKFVSKIAGREIVLRDAHRFHQFQDGVCSCGDYW